MRGLVRRLRGALGMGLTWAFGWALAGIGIGVASVLLPFLPWDVFLTVFDAPLPALAIPGFIGGSVFSVILGVAGRRRRFDELSIPRFAIWGAVGGAFLSILPLTLLATAAGNVPVVGLLLVAALPIGLGAASAAGSLALARTTEDERLLQAAELVGDVGLSADEHRRLLDS